MLRTLIVLAAAAALSLSAQQQNSYLSQTGPFLMPLASTNTIQGIAGTATAVTYTIHGREVTAAGVTTDKVLAQGQLAASAGALYTVTTGSTGYVASIWLANATSSAVSGVILYVNGTAAANEIIPPLTIPAYGSLIWSAAAGGWTMHDASGNILSAPYTTPGANSVRLTTVVSAAVAAATTTGLVLPTIGASQTVNGYCHLIWETSSTSGTPSFSLGMSNAPAATGLNVISRSWSTATAVKFTTITTTSTTAVTAVLTASAGTTGYVTDLYFELATSSNPVAITVYYQGSSASYTTYVEPGSACGWLP